MVLRSQAAWIATIFCLFATASSAQQVVVPDDSSKTSSSQLDAPEKGTDPYAPKVDWSQIPPWRQTSFYGIRAQGKTFIYVVDCSGSMADGGRLARAKIEIRRSVMAMQFPQKFHVIFYNDRPLPMPGGIPRTAGLDSTDRMISWFRSIEPEGETDPRAALFDAVSLKPDAVFLLSDGEFPKGTVEAIAKSNPKKIPIHCIDLAGGAAGDQLKRVARDSGGQYVPRPR
jgi:hypothetical protein